jgi:hypothetical protein
MNDEDRPKEDHSWIQRLNYAWEPLRSSLTIRIFGAVSVLALIDTVLGFHEYAVKAGWIDERVITYTHALK